MKVLYLHQYFNTPDMKGGTRSYEMAKRMVEQGHEVHIITSRRDSGLETEFWSKEVVDGIIVHWLPVAYNNTMSYRQRVKSFFRFALKAGKKAISIGGDIIFATSTPLTIAIPAVKAKKRLGVPMVFEVRDLWPELPIAMGALKLPFSKYFARKLERYAYFNADHIIGLSPGMTQGVLAAGYPSERVSTIPNSCDLDVFGIPRSAAKCFREERQWLGDRPLVLYAGTLGKINGVSWLADLASNVLFRNEEVRFLVLGEGGDESGVRRRAEELGVLGRNFFMEKRISKKDVTKALQAADICMSLFVPLKAMEANSANKFFDALAAGRPIAINYQGWQKDLILNNSIGLVLDQNDVALSAEKLVSLIGDERRKKIFGENARKLGEREFSRDILANKLIKTLTDVSRKSS